MNTVLIKQDPVMVANHKDEPPDPDTDFILQDSLPLFDNRYCFILASYFDKQCICSIKCKKFHN